MPGRDLIHGDRRADKRYAYELPLRFTYRSGGSECAGSGMTQDLGRKGIRFLAYDPPPRETELELRIEWPFLLQNVCPLELLVSGRVLRSDNRGTVVRITRYEFRTSGPRSFDQVNTRAGNWSIVA